MIKYLITILLLISGYNQFVMAQSAPDVITNSDSQQNPVIENQNFSNLYQAQTQTASTVAAINGYYNNGVLAPANGGTGQNSSAWTSGDVVYMQASGVWGHESPLSANPHANQIFLSSGTFTAPAGINKVYLSMIAGGGGGGGELSNSTGTCGGGGGGQSIVNYPYAVTAGSNYTVTVGAAGAGGLANANGSTGGTTTFDTLSVVGGIGGIGGSSIGLNGGLGGGIITATTTANSTGGTTGFVGGSGSKGGASFSGGGGGSLFGFGANGVTGNGAPGVSAGANTGAGGSGATSQGGGLGEIGGNGGSGLVIVQY